MTPLHRTGAAVEKGPVAVASDPFAAWAEAYKAVGIPFVPFVGLLDPVCVKGGVAKGADVSITAPVKMYVCLHDTPRLSDFISGSTRRIKRGLTEAKVAVTDVVPFFGEKRGDGGHQMLLHAACLGYRMWKDKRACS